MSAPMLMTIDQAAERLNTSPRFVRRLVAERRIPFTRLGRHIRLVVDDLDSFVESGRVEPMVHRVRHSRGRVR